MDNATIATSLEKQLTLQIRPIALSVVKEQPADVQSFDGVVPSACALWRRAEQQVFFATPADHYNCALGAMVMGFSLPDEQASRLQADVEMMLGMSYVRPEEVECIPKLDGERAGIVYGPLELFPLTPDAVLVWLTPEQAMLMNECCDLVNWAAEETGLLGRPGCASIPRAVESGRVSESSGCVGMRFNTKIAPELLLTVVPRDRLDTLTDELEERMKLTEALTRHYEQKAARVR
jgi:uncharacterized protein (DUF169 family)